LGQKYEHFQGGFYEFVGIAALTEDPTREVVVYRQLNPGSPQEQKLWARPADEFYGYVEVENPLVLGGKPLHVARFQEITDEEYLDLIGPRS
jgi:hypothetical protein